MAVSLTISYRFLNLLIAIEDELGKPAGAPISQAEMESLTDLTGLEAATI